MQVLIEIKRDPGSVQGDGATQQPRTSQDEDHQSQEQARQRQQGHPHEHPVRAEGDCGDAAGHQAGQVQVHRELQQVQPLPLRAEEGKVRAHHGDVQHMDEPEFKCQIFNLKNPKIK